MTLCHYREKWTDEVGYISVCVVHGENSRHTDSTHPNRPCLAKDPYPGTSKPRQVKVTTSRSSYDLFAEMMDWVEGRKSHWNYYSNATEDPAQASALCSQADSTEVQKFSAAVVAAIAMEERSSHRD